MMRNLNLSIRLWVFTGILLLALGVVAAVSILSIGGILDANGRYAKTSELAGFMVEKEVDHLSWVNRVQSLFIHNRKELDVELDPTRCSLGRFLHGEEGRRVAELDPDLGRLLGTMKEPHSRLHDSAMEINQAVARSGHKEAYRIFESETLPALRETQEVMGSVEERLAELLDSAEASMLSTGAASRRIVGVVTLVTIISGALLSYLLVRSITGPVREIIHGLRNGAGEVNSASAQLSSASHSIAEGASEQAASLEETSSSLEEISSMTARNAENAQTLTA